MKKEIIPLKSIFQELRTGENSLINPLIPAVIEAWSSVVPESLRPGISLEGFREGILYLLVSNPVVGQQFQFLRDSIRGKINEILEEQIVREIRVKPGPPPEKTPLKREK